MEHWCRLGRGGGPPSPSCSPSGRRHGCALSSPFVAKASRQRRHSSVQSAWRRTCFSSCRPAASANSALSSAAPASASSVSDSRGSVLVGAATEAGSPAGHASGHTAAASSATPATAVVDCSTPWSCRPQLDSGSSFTVLCVDRSTSPPACSWARWRLSWAGSGKVRGHAAQRSGGWGPWPRRWRERWAGLRKALGHKGQAWGRRPEWLSRCRDR